MRHFDCSPFVTYNASNFENQQEILERLQVETESPDYEHFGMIAVIIMSKGIHSECIHGADMNKVQLEEVCGMLTAGSFPSMKGKPKLVIVQAGGEC